MKCRSDVLGFLVVACANTLQNAQKAQLLLHGRRCRRQLLYFNGHQLGGELDHNERRIIADHFPSARRDSEKAEPSLDVILQLITSHCSFACGRSPALAA